MKRQAAALTATLLIAVMIITVSIVGAQQSNQITGISVDTATPGQATITWDAVGGAKDYRVMWAPRADDYKTWSDSSGNHYPMSNSQTLTGLTESAQYKFRVRARFQGSPSGPFSDETTFTAADDGVTIEVVPPARPGGLTAILLSHDSVTLSWNDPGDASITHYKVFRRLTGETSFTAISANTGSADTEYVDSTVAAGTTYDYAVTALNNDGASMRSAPLEVAVPAEGDSGNEARVEPEEIAETGNSTGTVTIEGVGRISQTLTAVPGTDITDPEGLTNPTYTYEWIAVSVDGVTDPEILDGETSVTLLLTEYLLYGKVRVRITFDDDEGNTNALVSSAFPDPLKIVRGTPAAPTNLSATKHGAQRIDLAWTAPLDGGHDITGYTVERSSDGETGWADAGSVTDPDVTSHPDTVLPESTWHYRVRASNKLGEGDPSETVSATTLARYTVGFTQSEETQLEEGGGITVCVEAFDEDDELGAGDHDIRFRIATHDSTAVAGEDYHAHTEEFNLGPTGRKTVGCFLINLINDRILESSPEVFRVKLTTDEPGEVILAPDTMTVEIYEGDTTKITLEAEQSTVHEGDPIPVSVLSQYHAEDRDFYFLISTTDGTATGDDYRSPTVRLKLPKKGLRTQTAHIITYVDAVTDPDETLTATVVGAPGGTDRRILLPGTSSNDQAPVTFTIKDVPVLIGISAQSDQDQRTTVSWTNPDDANITGYEYKIRTAPGNWPLDWTPIRSSHAGTTKHTIRDLEDATTYHVWIRSRGPDAPLHAGAAEATTLDPPTPPGLPLELTAAVHPGTGTATINWLRPEFEDKRVPITSFVVQTRPWDTQQSWRNVDSTLSAGNQQEALLTNIQEGATPEVQVAAVNRIGRGEWATISFRYQTPGELPLQLRSLVNTGPIIITPETAINSVEGYWVQSDTLDQCLGDQQFRIHWLQPTDTPLSYEAHFITHEGAYNVRHSFQDESDDRSWTGLRGTVNLFGESSMEIRLRAKFSGGLNDEPWTVWTSPTALSCTPGEMAGLEVPEHPNVTAPVNVRATGRTRISGYSYPGDTVTVNTGVIRDGNGLSRARFTYHWSRRSGYEIRQLETTTTNRYTLTEADANSELRVQITFSDDDGFEEIILSHPFTVRKRAYLVGEFDDDNNPAAFSGGNWITVYLAFSERVDISIKDMRDHALNITGGAIRWTTTTSDVPDYRGLRHNWKLRVEPVGGGDITISLPRTTNCNAQGALCTASGNMLLFTDTVTIPSS